MRKENLIYNGTDGSGKQQLENYIWDPDSTKTAIQILPVWAYKTQDIQRRPALYVKRNSWKSRRIAINEGQSVAVDPRRRGADVSGEYHSKVIEGSHTIFCVGSANQGAEAELLGAEVFDYLTSFAPILRGELRLLRLEVAGLEPLGLLEEATEHFVAPVVVTYGFAWTWRLQSKAPWLKSLAVVLGR